VVPHLLPLVQVSAQLFQQVVGRLSVLLIGTLTTLATSNMALKTLAKYVRRFCAAVTGFNGHNNLVMTSGQHVIHNHLLLCLGLEQLQSLTPLLLSPADFPLWTHVAELTVGRIPTSVCLVEKKRTRPALSELMCLCSLGMLEPLVRR